MKTHAKEASCLSDQWVYFKRHFADFIIVMQKGSCWLLETRHLKYLSPLLQGDCQKQGIMDRLEIPLYHLKKSLNLFEKKSLAYVLITEQGYVHNRLKQRKLRQVYLAANTV